MPDSRDLPPEECCLGTSPSQVPTVLELAGVTDGRHDGSGGHSSHVVDGDNLHAQRRAAHEGLDLLIRFSDARLDAVQMFQHLHHQAAERMVRQLAASTMAFASLRSFLLLFTNGVSR